MSSTCSSCRRRSPAIAAASSGSKPSMVMVVRNMRAVSITRTNKRARIVPGSRGLDQVFDDRGPGLRQIGAVVAASTEAEHAAVTEALGELAQVAGGAPMNLRREAQMSDGVALETVRTALQDDELRLELLEVRQHPRPDGCEHLIVGAGRQGHIELRARGGAPTDFPGGARARIQV